MGGFINSQSDNEICEVLNKRFSDDVNANGQTYLDELRQFFRNKEKLFSNSHKLNRIFHRLAISVTGGASVSSSEGQPTGGRRPSDKRPTHSHLEPSQSWQSCGRR
jgi:hypothetical protein